MGGSTAKNIEGMTFGLLTGVRRVGTYVSPKRKRAAIWLFSCSCGGEKTATLHAARRPDKNGCLRCRAPITAKNRVLPRPPPPRRIDITGQKFGKLTAVTSMGGTWDCVCECGRHCYRKAGDLRADIKRGRMLSCGSCLRRADLVGEHFGRLTVIAMEAVTASGCLWTCRCECGGTSSRLTSQLRVIKNPGCKDCEPFRRAQVHITHGGAFMGRSRLYNVWKGMRARCADAKNAHYGAKGIKVCREWEEFAVFRFWAHENGYANGLSIDRLDPSKGYSPANCEWVTRDENSRRVWKPKMFKRAEAA
jgi:hypothetical protein